LTRISQQVSERGGADGHGAWRFAPSVNMLVSEGPAGILDSMSRSPTERNTVDMPGSVAAVESW
jgi:hypothetical protein